jgi:hypothetical protein
MPELSSGKFNNLMDRSSRKAGREACKERRSLRTLATRAYYKKAEEIWSIDGGSAAHAAFACSVGPFPTRALKSISAGTMAVVAHCSATTIMASCIYVAVSHDACTCEWRRSHCPSAPIPCCWVLSEWNLQVQIWLVHCALVMEYCSVHVRDRPQGYMNTHPGLGSILPVEPCMKVNTPFVSKYKMF